MVERSPGFLWTWTVNMISSLTNYLMSFKHGGLGLNESVPISYKRVQEVTRKPKTRNERKKKKKPGQPSLLFSFFFFEIDGHP